MKSEEIIAILDKLYPEAQCELNYKHDYELLIALVLSAQTTDQKVNSVTEVLFAKYDLYSLAKASIKDIENILYPLGTHRKKAIYVQKIAEILVNEWDGIIPNNRSFIEGLPGVGRKCCNVFLANIYNVPAFAVDTHVARVSNRLGIASSSDVQIIEQTLRQFFPKEKWSRLHHQLVLFGRYMCKSKNPSCNICPFKDKCKFNQEKISQL